jgi:hypothetical protein
VKAVYYYIETESLTIAELKSSSLLYIIVVVTMSFETQLKISTYKADIPDSVVPFISSSSGYISHGHDYQNYDCW